jgi:hypothetical protein
MQNLKRAVDNLVSAIVQRSKNGYPFYGTYCLQIRGTPRIPKPTSPEGKRIIEQATVYMGVTGTAAKQASEQLFSDQTGEVLIEKRSRYAGSVSIEFIAEA